MGHLLFILLALVLGISVGACILTLVVELLCAPSDSPYMSPQINWLKTLLIALSVFLILASIATSLEIV